jgi:cell wall-associated NlpC family hydrolase
MSVLQRILIVALIGFFNSAHAQTTVGTTTADSVRTTATTTTSVQPTDSLSEYVDEIILFAKRFIGTPYHYGGGTPAGFDCSGSLIT